MVQIKQIEPTKANLKKFTQFQIDLYDGNPYYVPPLISDDVDTLLPEANPAFDFCEAAYFMAYRDNKPVGRIAAIINRQVNEKSNSKDARFGFIDFIDDTEVSSALLKAAEDWSRKKGMKKIIGPLGFTDLDHEGMLIAGFDELSTMATIYNHPYYPEHMQRLGFEKEVDWVEYRITVPEQIPERYQRVADLVARKFGLKVHKITSRSKVKEQYGQAIFDLINESYAGLYGYSPLTPRQINYYIDEYIGMLRLEDVCLVVDSDDRLVAVGISMPSMSRALQKSRGRLWPTGWFHLLKALKGGSDVVDLLLVAVKPEYQGKGVNAMLFCDLIPHYRANGYREAESNLELEGNESVQKQWEAFERRLHRRRRAYRKPIAPQVKVLP